MFQLNETLSFSFNAFTSLLVLTWISLPLFKTTKYLTNWPKNVISETVPFIVSSFLEIDFSVLFNFRIFIDSDLIDKYISWFLLIS